MPLIADGESTTSLPVSRKERGTVLEGSHRTSPCSADDAAQGSRASRTPMHLKGPTLPKHAVKDFKGLAKP